MDMQPPVVQEDKDLEEVYCASLFLPSNQYSTAITVYPASSCCPPWGTHGRFFLSFNLYNEGVRVAEYNTNEINEDGVVQVNFDNVAAFYDDPLSGLLVTKFYHTKTIPIDLYIAHFHKTTEEYLAYPALMYMGDTIYTNVHAQQLENTLFWPGLIQDEHNEMVLMVVNPYKVSYSYQVSLFGQSRQREQTSTMKIQPYSVKSHPLTELFSIKHFAGKIGHHSSLCISAQYKLVAYIMVRNKDTGTISTVDHLHTYCLI